MLGKLIKADEYYKDSLSKDDKKAWEPVGAGGNDNIKDRLAALYAPSMKTYKDLEEQTKKQAADTNEATVMDKIEAEIGRLQRESDKEAERRAKNKRSLEKDKSSTSKDKPARRGRKNQKKDDGESELAESSSPRAFCFAGSLRGPNGTKELGSATIHADQGSDFNIITEDLARACGLCIQRTATPIQLRMADGRERSFQYFTLFDFGARKIWRKIECLVLDNMPRKRDRLLLGLPWLYDVDAKLDIRKSLMTIGDVAKGESEECIRGPSLFLGMSPTTGDAFAATAADSLLNGTASNPGLVREPSLQEVYHDLTVSKFRLSDMPAWNYFLDFPAPVADPDMTSSTSSGKTGWVALEQYIVLLKRDNLLPATDGRPKLSDRCFQRLETWLPASGLYPGGADATLSILLNAFFDNDAATDIMGKTLLQR